MAGPGGAPVDVAAVLAEIVAGVAANLGSLDRLLAGRSGSWEADLVGQIVAAGLGDDPITWRARRTAPVVVRVCVALVAHDAGLPNVDDLLDQAVDHREADAAWAAISDAYAAWGQAFRAAVEVKALTWPELTAAVVVDVDTDPRALWWSAGYQARLAECADDDLAAQLLAAGHEGAGPLRAADPVTDSSRPSRGSEVSGDV